MKKRKTYKLSLLTYLTVSLAVFTVLFGVFAFSYAYFNRTQLATGAITLGELDFQVLNNLSVLGTQEANLFMPGEVINNSITVLNARDAEGLNISGLASCFLRIKPIITINSINESSYLHVELTTPNDWIQGEDGFLYYINKILPGEHVVFNDYFALSSFISNQHQNLPLYLGLEIDTVQSQAKAYLDTWPTAPQEWVDIVNML